MRLLRAFLDGVGSVLDLFGTRTPMRRGSPDGLAADREAIAGDWQQLGDDPHGSVARIAAETRTCCSPEAFAPLLQHLGQELEAHADRDGLTGVRRAVFLARGGHAPGGFCPSEPAPEPDPQSLTPQRHGSRYWQLWDTRPQPGALADAQNTFVRRLMAAEMADENDAILTAALAGAGRTPPCGVRVRRKFGEPALIGVDPTVPVWEVHEHAA